MGVCVALPAKNCESTIGLVIDSALKSRHRPAVIVIDGFSSDRTREVAEAHGARVFLQSERVYPGKGVAMRDGILRALELGDFDVLVFLDADIKNLTPEWVDKLVDEIVLNGVDVARGYYQRRPRDAPVTKLVARPLLSIFFPELSHIRQPLSGEVAARMDVWRMLVAEKDIPKGWGIDIWFLIEAAMKGFKISEVFLGFKDHASYDDYSEDVEPLKDMAKQIEITVIKEALKYGRMKRLAQFQA